MLWSDLREKNGASATSSTPILAAAHAEPNSQSRPSRSSRSANASEPTVSAFANSEPATGSALPRDPETSVTPRQLELLALYASGYGYEQIGSMKFLSPYTVKYHMSRAVNRSGARNLTHLCTALVEAKMLRRNADNIYEPNSPDLRIAGE